MATRFCTKCGSALIESNRFCTRCGATVAPHAKPPIEPVQQAPAPAIPPPPLEKTTAPAAPENVLPETPPPAPYEPAPIPETTAQHVPQPAATVGDKPPSRPLSTGVIVGIVAAVLVLLAAGGFGWYALHQKAATVEAPVAEPAAEPAVATPGASAAKPSPSTPATAVPSQPEPSTTMTRSHAPEPAPEPTPAPITRDTPSDGLSGVLRYSGPPVPLGGVVVFSGLPGSMLKLSYDRSSWEPRFSRQSNGTQTLTLRSIKQQDQTQCIVHWEVPQ